MVSLQPLSSVRSCVTGDSSLERSLVGTGGTLGLFNFSSCVNRSAGVTPYFRNYIFSRRDAGSLRRSMANPTLRAHKLEFLGLGYDYRLNSKSSKWRLRYFRIWSLGNSIASQSKHSAVFRRRSNFNMSASKLPLFGNLFCTGSGVFGKYWSTCAKNLVPFWPGRLWLGYRSFVVRFNHFTGLGLLRRLFFKSWVLLSSQFSATLVNFTKEVYYRMLFLLPYRFTSVAFDSGAFSAFRSKRVAYGAWHRVYPKQTKFYKRKRLLITRYTRDLFDVRRSRFVRKMCLALPHTEVNRIHAFRVLFHARLVTFVSFVFNVQSHVRATLLVRTGHVFVNGECVTNVNFSLTSHDVVSFSRIALSWVSSLRRHRRSKASLGRSRIRRYLASGWRPRLFRRKFEKAVVMGPFQRFAVIKHISALPIRPFKRKYRTNSFLSNNRIRFLLGTLDF